jgi:hypothetical protein
MTGHHHQPWFPGRQFWLYRAKNRLLELSGILSRT